MSKRMAGLALRETPDPDRRKKGRKKNDAPTVNLAPSEPTRVPNKPRKGDADERPSDKQKRRQDEAAERTTLGEALGQAASYLPPGRGVAGHTLHAAVSGAAVGATLGEELARIREAKRQRGRARKPRTMSEFAADE